MKLKSLIIFAGEGGLRLNNTRMEGEGTVSQPIDFDPETEIVVQHISDTKKKIIKLKNVAMYDYEEDKPILQS